VFADRYDDGSAYDGSANDGSANDAISSDDMLSIYNDDDY
jgi:hypothetical protein